MKDDKGMTEEREHLKGKVVRSLLLKGEPEAAKTFLRILAEVKANPEAENGYPR